LLPRLLVSLGLLSLGRLLHLLAGLWLLQLLALLGPLATLREELARLGVTRSLLGQVVHPLAELLGVAPVLGAPVRAAPPLARDFGLLAGLLCGDLSLLALHRLLAALSPGLLALRLLQLRLRLLLLGLLHLLLGLLHSLTLGLLGLLLGLLGLLLGLLALLARGELGALAGRGRLLPERRLSRLRLELAR